MIFMFLYALQALALAQASTVTATAAPALMIPPPPPPAYADIPVSLTKGTRITLTLNATLTSNESHPGDRFPIELAEPVTVDGKLLLAAGTRGEGEVVHAAKARWGGKAGELIINARFLDCAGTRVPLGKLKFAEAGQNNAGVAMVASAIALPAVFFISGGSVIVPSGTRFTASITGDVLLPARSEGRCAGVPIGLIVEGKQ